MSRDQAPLDHLAQQAIQVASNAGTICGVRQGIQQCAENLRRQAQTWREEARLAEEREPKPKARRRARKLRDEAEQWAQRIDRIADAMMQEHARHEQAEAQQLKTASALLGALQTRIKAKKRWFFRKT